MKSLKLPDNKCKRRKIYHIYESLMLQRNKSADTPKDRLDKLGYRSKEEYTDCVSHLAW